MASVDGAVSTHAVERFPGDLALEPGWAFDATPVELERALMLRASLARNFEPAARPPRAPSDSTRGFL